MLDVAEGLRGAVSPLDMTREVENCLFLYAEQMFGPGARILMVMPQVPLDLILDTWTMNDASEFPFGSRVYAMQVARYNHREPREEDAAYVNIYDGRYDHTRAPLPSNVLWTREGSDIAMLQLGGCLWASGEYNRAFSASFFLAGPDADFSALVHECEQFVRDKVTDRRLMLRYKDGGESYHKLPEGSWDEVILGPTLKRDLRHSVESFLTGADTYAVRKVPYRRGLLLAGPPGNGKTTVARVIAATCGRPVIYWTLGRETDDADVDEVFRLARRHSPAVVIVEDLDAISQCHVSRSVFLNALDGFDAPVGALLLGTTNYPENIDPALLNRAGRFDRLFVLPVPDADERREFLTRHLGDLLPASDIEGLVGKTKDLSFAQIGEIRTDMVLRQAGEECSAQTLLAHAEAIIDEFLLRVGQDPDEWGAPTKPRIGFQK